MNVPKLLLCLLTAPLAAQSTPPPASLAGSRPNIIFLYSDDHAAHAISAYGSQRNDTPHIDRIADGGMRFDHAFCGNSLCGPARASIQTGLHSHRNGFMRNGNRFDAAQRSLGKEMQKAGYQTAVIGKWHLESDPVGYDHWMVLPGQGQYYNPDFLTAAGRERLTGHATDLTMDLALDWLAGRDAQRPFLLLCQFKAPHRNWMPAPQDLSLYRDADVPEPATLFDDYEGRLAAAKTQEMTVQNHLFLHYDLLVPPVPGEVLRGEDQSYPAIRARMTPAQREAWDAAYGSEDAAFLANPPQGAARVRWYYQRYIKNYLRCVAGVDRNVGRLLEWLEAHPQLRDNTLVVYGADQGFYLGDHGWYDKRWMYEESLRMPLLMRWPTRIKAGGVRKQLVQNIDLMPTFLELAGAPVPSDLHGVSLVPLLGHEANVPWRDAIYYHYYESHAVHMVPAMYGVRTDRYKLIRYYEPQTDTWELFDLQQDPHELASVYNDASYAPVREALRKRLHELRSQYGDDTGEVALAQFPVQAGVARVVEVLNGQRVWCNAEDGYLLRPCASAPPTQFRVCIAPTAAGRLQNGFLVFAGDAPRQLHLRAGIEFRTKQLVLRGGQARSDASIPWDGKSAVELTVTFDAASRRLLARAAGAEATLEVPAKFGTLSAYGFGGSDAEAIYTKLTVE